MVTLIVCQNNFRRRERFRLFIRQKKSKILKTLKQRRSERVGGADAPGLRGEGAPKWVFLINSKQEEPIVTPFLLLRSTGRGGTVES